MISRPAITRVPKVALLLESSTEYGRSLIRGIVRYARLRGPWSLAMMPGHVEQALPKVKAWDGDGIIGRVSRPALVRGISSTGLAFVACFLHEFPSPKDRHKYFEVRANSELIAQMGAAHLLERGLRHFGFCGFARCPWSNLREQTFVRYLETRGFLCARYRIDISPWQSNWIQSWRHERATLSKWLKSLPKPVGIMACNDACGVEVLEACADTQLRSPDDVAVLGVDNDELLCDFLDPPLSSVSLNLEQAGYEAASLLDKLMHRKIRRGRVVPVQPILVHTRKSTDVIAVDDPAAAKALRFIRDYTGRPIAVGDVVDAVGISRRTLERRVRRATGSSLLSEISRCMLARAKHLLLETDLPCYRVSLEAGFGSVKAFNRTFRQMEGMTPKMFRRGSPKGGWPRF